MLSWLAAGYRGWFVDLESTYIGWNLVNLVCLIVTVGHRPARRAGAIGKAAKKYRRELWQADKQPMVGVLQDFDNEAMWAAMAVLVVICANRRNSGPYRCQPRLDE